jgi:cation transport ATPase
MTCESCVEKVTSSLLCVKNITKVAVSKIENKATLTMEKHVPIEVLQNALPEKYKILPLHHQELAEQTKNWFVTYKPILLIFFYITSITLLIQLKNSQFELMQWMNHFMAGFFLVFSFFKLLNLKGFTESYVMYDVLAKKVPIWAYLYAFIELSLGIAYLLNWNPIAVNSITFIVMSISIIGVLQTVLNKKKIQCACLGAIFNLPMSTVTIIEDGLMIIMSGYMIMSLS